MILPAHNCSLTITHNPHKDYCQSVKQHIEDDFFNAEFISEEEKSLAIETNELWVIDWYPETPIGFHWFCAQSLENLLKFVAQESEMREYK